MEKFGIIDGVIIGIIALSILTGLIRGFVKELISLSVWVSAIWLGAVYADTVGVYLKSYITDELACHAAGFIIIMLSVIIIGSLLNAIFGFILKTTGLSGTDRVLGMMFGGVRGVFFVSVIILAIRVTDLLPLDKYIDKSLLYNKFNPVVDWLRSVSPDFVKNINKPNKEDVDSVNKDI